MPNDNALWAEEELRRRYGAPTTDTDKVVGFTLHDARHLALKRDVRGIQIWLEDDPAHNALPAHEVRHYQAKQSRHSNLPPRLRHQPPGSTAARAVCLVTIADPPMLRAVLDYYEAGTGSGLNRAALEHYRLLFLARYPDFTSFVQTQGGYVTEERAYKDKLIARAANALAEVSDDVALGARLLDVITGRTGVKSGLLGWRTDGRIQSLRAAHPEGLERATARLARAEDVDVAIAEFVGETWPLLVRGQTSKPYSESRNLPTMLAAIIHPDGAYGINTDPVQRTAEALLGHKPLGGNPMTAEEYAAVYRMAEAIRAVMANEWDWMPRDMWDVQGFIWVVNRTNQPELTEYPAITRPTKEFPLAKNLIFYGPPGTGKTYATAAEAVQLCGQTVPEDRAELMTVYRRLADAGQIEFVTFHQSTAYEEFVEGLRPVQTSESGAAGFELQPVPGVLRRIARRAETSTGSGHIELAISGHKVFKMSIGEAANPDDASLFDEAIADGCTLLGFEEIDWTDDCYADREEIIKACRSKGVTNGEPTQSSGRVQMPFMFRNEVEVGDIVVVSKGNGLFRAIGQVTGGYSFVPRESGAYGHRRAVRWLWVDRAGVPASEIYARNFMMKSIYRLSFDDLNVPALERYIASQQGSGTAAPEPFVLIIDEINRANVSKVFGELITLLEPDKRLGQPNALRVRLPYSGELFGVPANLNVIGTMNTADRSIALLDTALRRRFTFRELMPDPLLLGTVGGINLATVLKKINDSVEYLYDREHQVGHAYFLGCETRADIDAVMREKLIPLLAEYFHEDWGKIAAVLGDATEMEGDREGGFLSRRQLAPPPAFGGGSEATPRYRWTVRDMFDYSKLQ